MTNELMTSKLQENGLARKMSGTHNERRPRKSMRNGREKRKY